MKKSFLSSLKQLRRDLLHRDFKKKIYPFSQDKNGLEVGGPSKIFARELPLYNIANNIDGCNFSTRTMWEGTIAAGLHYNYTPGKTGYQFISEASNLQGIENNHYDFLLASHCLEHCANALKTMEEWLRVTRPGGCLLLILPDRRFTFDHNRPITSFEHLLEDYHNNTGENDTTHLEEIFALHDFSRDRDSGSEAEFKARSYKNIENRGMHHHVFDFALLEKIYAFFGIAVIGTEFIYPYHQVIAGKKK